MHGDKEAIYCVDWLYVSRLSYISMLLMITFSKLYPLTGIYIVSPPHTHTPTLQQHLQTLPHRLIGCALMASMHAKTNLLKPARGSTVTMVSDLFMNKRDVIGLLTTSSAFDWSG